MSILQIHRRAIGLYLDTAQSLSALGKGKTTMCQVSKNSNNVMFKLLSQVNVKIVLVCLSILIQVINFHNQIESGDIETNPGPTYNIENVVHGSFHQGNRHLFGETAGIQCACNALYALCWTKIKEIFQWGKADMDHILVEGDRLYKSLDTLDMLSVDQLPAFVKMFTYNIPVQYIRLETQLATLIDGDSFLRDLMTPHCDSVLCLLIMEGFTTAVMLSRNKYYIFDSHSRDERGLSVVDGTSVLMKFRDFYEVEKYIQVAYLEYRDKQQAYFQLQFIEVTVQPNEKTEIYSQFVRKVRLEHNRKFSSDINRKNQEYYASLQGSPKHSHIKMKKRQNSKLAYAQMKGTPKYTSIMDKRKDIKKRRLFETNFDRKVKKFKQHIKNGPYFVCVICNRCLYKTSVVRFHQEKYVFDESIIFMVKSYDNNCYICITCEKALRKNSIPCQAVFNKLHVTELPKKFQSIRRLEKLLVSRRILFKKVTVMPKGNSLKMKGSICNIPISEVDTNCNMLPRPADSNGLILVKLKRKLEYKGHVVFEGVRPSLVLQFLEFLKNHNSLYSDIEINTANIPIDILDLQHSKAEENKIYAKLLESLEEPIEIKLETLNEESQEDPLSEFRAPSTETTFVSEIPSACELEEGIVVAPGEGKKPVSILNDKYCEELAHPHLFPTGQYGYKVDREIPLTPSKYFNQRLLNYTQKFASDNDFIFFAHSVLQKVQLSSQINIAMKKVLSNKLTAGVLSSNFKHHVKECIAKGKAFSFMSSVKGTPAYWKKFLHQVLAMVKQLGTPTFFLTLSCADLRWNELISIIYKLNSLDISDDEIDKMSYHERCETLNKNPVLVARHFQYRVEMFFKTIVLDGPLGKTQYYAIRVEFQVRGSPHVHSFIWILNAPKLTKSNVDDYKKWVDGVIRSDLPDPDSEPALFELVKTYQIHRHSKTCRKYRKEKCRFHFGKFFTENTIIAQPIAESVPESVKVQKMQQRNTILQKVRNYIDNELNPSKRNFFDKTKDDYEELKSISEILKFLGITKHDYEEALSISDDNDFQIHYKRPPNSCFVNNYFCHGLMAWEANMDIQPVFNHYKAVAYMCAYLSKSENECSIAMKQAVTDAFEKELNNYEQMKSVANAYINKRECSIQECVYHILPGQWLRKTFPAVIFANSNLPEKRFRVCLTEEEVSELPEDSTKIFKRNIVDRYVDRPNLTSCGGKFAVLDAFCFAEFCRYYYLPSNPKYNENDYQPEELRDELVEDIFNTDYLYPREIKLLSNEKMKCRKTPYVLQYFVPNKEINPEEYAHHMLFMYYPFRDEKELLSDNLFTYASKLAEPGVIEVVNQNYSLVEPFATIVDSAFERLNSDIDNNIMDSYGQQENDEVNEVRNEYQVDSDTDAVDEIETHSADFGNYNLLSNRFSITPDNVINENIRSLNMKQREVFNFVHKWARDYIKSLSCKVTKKIKSFNIFITGGAGVGKSHLIKTIYMSLHKVLGYKGGDLEKPRILLLAPTGVAAININGTTIHSGLGINVGGKLYPLNDQQRATLRNKLSEVRLIIIDEISMVSNALFFQVNQRLNEIFRYSGDEAFAGLPVIVCGDFYQLPPVKGLPVYSSASLLKSFLALDLWRKFCMVELTEVMRQRGDQVFISLLNKIRIGEIDSDVENTLISRFLKEESFDQSVVHMFAENKPVKNHNETHLNNLNAQLVVINAIDEFPKNIVLSESQIESIKQRKISETGNLESCLKLKIGAHVMLTSNIDIDDRLVNGLVGTVKYFKYTSNKVVVVYIKFNDDKAGSVSMESDLTGRQNHWVPIKKREVLFGLRKNKQQPSVKRTQFPLTLSWACTVHKVQGLSLIEGVVSFDLEKQRSFNQGQMYVALSRVTSMNKLYLIGKYNKTALKVNVGAKIEYERLRNESLFKSQSNIAVSGTTLTISLLNVRSLKAHVLDIAKDNRLLDNDILCLTETHVEMNTDTSTIESALHYTMHFNNNENKFKSIAYCYSKDIDVLTNEDLGGVSIFTIRKQQFSNNPISIAIIYRPPNSKLSEFFECLSYIVSSRCVDIVVGDFNIDAFDEVFNERLKQVLSNYNLNVHEPTHLDGALLDHVYFRKSFEDGKIVTSVLNNIYFSDHDAVKVQLELKQSITDDIDFEIDV